MGIEPTNTSLIWILCGLAAFFTSRIALLSLLIFASAFQANSVFGLVYNEVNFPIIPYYWVGILIFVRLLLDLLAGRLSRVPPGLGLATLSFVLLGFYALISIIVLPFIFGGLPVYDPRGGIDEQYMNPSTLKFSLSMIGQTVLLWLNILILFWSAVYPKKHTETGKLLKWLQWSIAFTVGIALWQFVARYLDVPFPYELFHNVKGWSLGYDQTVEDIQRVSGSFTEPSNLATFLLGFTVFLLALGVSRKTFKGLHVLFMLSLTTLLLTTSTTAYIGLTLVGILIITFHFIVPLIIKGKIDRKKVISIIIGMGLTSAMIIMLATVFWEPVFKIIRVLIVEKGDSGSFVHRLASDFHAIKLFFQTAMLGVGIGGNRPSSFLTWLLSNVGIFGSLLFMIGTWYTAQTAIKSACKEGAHRSDRCSLAVAMMWGLVGTLMAKFIAQPDLNFPSLWIWLILLAFMSSVDKPSERKAL